MSFGNNDPQITSTTAGIYEGAEPYVQDILSESARLYGSDVGRNYYPGSTVIPFAPESQAGLDMREQLGYSMAGPSNLYGTAESTLGGFATGLMPDAYMNRGLGQGMGLAGGLGSSYTGRQAYGELQPTQDYLSAVRSGITSDVMGDVQSQFGGMGRTGTSPQAQQAAARGITQAYAPIAQSAAEAERARELGARESDIARQQQAGTSSLGRQYGATEAQLGRQYGASQSDIARQQQARESGLGRMFTGAQQLPGLQSSMDARRMGGVENILGVGGAYEGLAGRELQDRLNRYQFEQQSPYTRLGNFSEAITGIAGLRTPNYQYGTQPSPLSSAFAMGNLGASLGGLFGDQSTGGYSGYGAVLGGLGGLLGL